MNKKETRRYRVLGSTKHKNCVTRDTRWSFASEGKSRVPYHIAGEYLGLSRSWALIDCRSYPLSPLGGIPTEFPRDRKISGVRGIGIIGKPSAWAPRGEICSGKLHPNIENESFNFSINEIFRYSHLAVFSQCVEHAKTSPDIVGIFLQHCFERIGWKNAPGTVTQPYRSADCLRDLVSRARTKHQVDPEAWISQQIGNKSYKTSCFAVSIIKRWVPVGKSSIISTAKPKFRTSHVRKNMELDFSIVAPRRRLSPYHYQILGDWLTRDPLQYSASDESCVEVASRS
jgi:hypothetical protein